MSLALCLLSVLPVVAQADDAKVDDREKQQGTVEAAIDYAIELLEAKEYRKMIESLAHPEDLKKITDAKSLDEVAAGFGDNKAAEILTAFKSIKMKKPTYNDEKTRAEFSKESFPELKRDLRFEKSDKLWYIRN